MDIAELSRRSGLPASTLRYYEEKGLIASVGRHGLRRIFDDAVMQKLALIALAQQAGFSLNEIAGMFDATGQAMIDRTQLHAKADELDVSIRRLSAMRDGLRHAAQCPAPSHVECPEFQKLMQTALAGPRVRTTPVPK